MKKKEHKSPVVAVVDFGSSAIRAMAVEKNADGTLRILGVEESTKQGIVKKGVIVQTTDASMQLGTMLRCLVNRVNAKEEIKSVYVVVGGEWMQVCNVHVKREQSIRSAVPDKTLEDMFKESMSKVSEKNPEVYEIDSEAICYYLDKEVQLDKPSNDQKARSIEADYIVALSKRKTWEQLEGACNRKDVSIKNCWSIPTVLSIALLSDRDREAGCAIIDFGAQTTTLNIYKNNYCQLAKVVAFGAENITRDLEALHITHDTAEKLKVGYGYASPLYVEKDQNIRMRSTDPNNPTIQLSTTLIAQCIQARLDEILKPIVEKINEADEIERIYITGGGSMLKGLIPYLQSKTNLPVEFGSHADWLMEDEEQQYYMPQYSSLVGLAALAVEDTDKEQRTNPPFFKKVGDTIYKLFEPNEL